MKISVIVPCYNEEEVIGIFYKEMKKVMEQMRGVFFELLFIDDGSSDNTLNILRDLSRKDIRCKYFSFSRNFGKEAAMYAGLKNAEGDYVAIMDADLQDPPSLLPKMFQILQEKDYDCVATRRANRKGEAKIRSFLSDTFYKVVNKISDTEIVSGARDYRLMNRTMVDAILELSEKNRFTKGIYGWVGFKTKWLEFDNVERAAGETKWSLRQLFAYSLEGITGFSVAPLSFATVVGVIFSLVTCIMVIINLVYKLMWNYYAFTWMAPLVLFVSSLQFICIGILGKYLANTYLETKNRPIYIISDTSDGKKKARKIV